MTTKTTNIEYSDSSPFERFQPSLDGIVEDIGVDRAPTNKLNSLTVNIVPLYKKCNAGFRSPNVLPQRVLTNPSEAVLNNGLDNVEANLICRVHDKFISGKKVFTVLDVLGTGTFGQVFRCQRDDTKEIVAVKIIKNKPAYHSQGLLEIKIATLMNEEFDPLDEKHIVRLLESFEFKGHICLVFELLSMSLLDVLTQNQFRGLSLSVVQRFTRQILTALVALQEANVIHCDLKPENILLVPPPKRDRSESSMAALAVAAAAAVASANADQSSLSSNASSAAPSEPVPPVKKAPSSAPSDLKVIDFGSACFEGRTIYSYIQSRFYRSPEVLLGMPYNGAIDMWSLACVCAEMYLGLPLFPGVSQHNQLSRIVEMLGAPPDFLIECKNGAKYFSVTSSPPARSGTGHKSGGAIDSNSLSSVYLNASSGKYRLKSAEEYAAESNTEVPVLKKYLRYSQLDEVVMKCPLSNKSKLTPEQKHAEMMRRRSFLDFLQGLFNLNPFDRWTAQQAMGHPFVTNTPFSGVPFQPAVDLKAKERKLVYMYQTKQFAVDGDSAPGGLKGLRTPTNFGSSTLSSTVVSSALGKHAFVPLQAVNRRLTEPMDTGGSKSKHLLQAGTTVSAKTVTQAISPPSGRPSSPAEDLMTIESRPSLKRGNPVHIKPAYVEKEREREGDHQRPRHQPQSQGQQQTSGNNSHQQSRPQQSASLSIPMMHSAPQQQPSSPSSARRQHYNSNMAPPPAQQQYQQQQHSLRQYAHQQQSFQQPGESAGGGFGNVFGTSPGQQQQGMYATSPGSYGLQMPPPQPLQQQYVQPQVAQHMTSQSYQQYPAIQVQSQPQQMPMPHPMQITPQQQQQQMYINSAYLASSPYQNALTLDMQRQHQHQQQLLAQQQQYYMVPQQTLPPQQQQQAPYMQQYQQQQQQYAASLNSSSMGMYAAGGSMQDGTGGGGMVVMTDFGLALLRPDMDEHRRLLSQNNPAPILVPSSSGPAGSATAQQYYQQAPSLMQQQQQQQQYTSSPGAFKGKNYTQQLRHTAIGQQQQHQQQQHTTSMAQSLDTHHPNSPNSRSRPQIQTQPGRVQGAGEKSAHSPTASSSRRTYKAAYTQRGDQGSPVVHMPPVPPLPPAALTMPSSSSSSLSTPGAASSLSISIPLQMAPAPEKEQVLAYSFQNPHGSGSGSVVGGSSINYSNQWENTSMAAAASSAASLSRSMGQSRSVSSIQQQMRRTGSREAVAALAQDSDGTEAESSGSSPKDVTYKASERNSESSTHSLRSTDSDDALRRSSQHTSDDKLAERGRSESQGNASAPVTDAVAVAADALADWDPFFDSDD